MVVGLCLSCGVLWLLLVGGFLLVFCICFGVLLGCFADDVCLFDLFGLSGFVFVGKFLLCVWFVLLCWLCCLVS